MKCIVFLLFILYASSSYSQSSDNIFTCMQDQIMDLESAHQRSLWVRKCVSANAFERPYIVDLRTGAKVPGYQVIGKGAHLDKRFLFRAPTDANAPCLDGIRLFVVGYCVVGKDYYDLYKQQLLEQK